MTTFLLDHEPALRVAAFLGVLAAMMAWELASPVRRQEVPRVIRWTNNLGLVIVDTAILRLAFPLLAVGLATRIEGGGLFGLLSLPGWVAVPLGLLLLDLAIYFQHRVFHAVPLLWRLHRMHHADPDFDTTTALRFHPVEIVLSMAIKLAVVALLGLPPVAVLVFEVILNATALFNHGNVSLPPRLEPLLRRLIVTPDMHRVHHSTDPVETNSNYGFNLPWWDRIFGTYRPAARLGSQMETGLTEFRAPREQWIDRLLLQPFRRQTERPKRRPTLGP
ncbi:sterol desaturase family protein [Stagnihabitans tardus]|uniref:Sterol desaturase family protein n=1 Tax=Stagnihabitans tardus TaxID=2699202 RepID=A0AAE5BTK8_9RHOB|nr:sterol desaturase family protein [Stagnihabitans tardus]NBZ86826.1 sterol desaturase family protein [Stagnihabitans tardus]